MYGERDPNRFKTERVYNRTNRLVRARFDGIDEEFAPQEERWLPQAIAVHCRKRTIVAEDPTTGEALSMLVILKRDDPLPALLGDEVLNRKEALIRENLDPKTDNAGHVLRAEIKNIHPDRREMLGIASSQTRSARIASGEILTTDEDFQESLAEAGAKVMSATDELKIIKEALAPAAG
jgi:hypothetical protein